MDHQAVTVLSPEEEARVLKEPPSESIIRARMARRDKNEGKRDANGVAMSFRPKSRLCVQGFLEPSTEGERNDAPTVSTAACHFLFAVAAGCQLTLGSTDISSAFLNGDVCEKEIYYRIPPDLHRNLMSKKLLPAASKPPVVKVRKGVYGLRSAPSLWWTRLRRQLLELGLEQLKTDPCLFVRRGPAGLELAVATHVDDLLFAGTQAGIQQLQTLSQHFKIKSWEFGNFVYCGRRVIQLPNKEVTVDMADYVAKLELAPLSKVRRSQLESPCTADERRSFRSVVGGLSWLGTHGRPDLCFEMSRLQGHLSQPLVRHLVEANRCVRTANRFVDVCIRFPPMNLNTAEFVAISDASFGNMPGGRS